MYSSTNKWLSLVLRWRMLNRFWMTKILTWKWLLIVANFCKRNWRYFMILRWQWRSEQLIFLFFLIRISSRYKEKSRQYDNWQLKKNCHSPAKISYHESKIKKCHGAQNMSCVYLCQRTLKVGNGVALWFNKIVIQAILSGTNRYRRFRYHV